MVHIQSTATLDERAVTTAAGGSDAAPTAAAEGTTARIIAAAANDAREVTLATSPTSAPSKETLDTNERKTTAQDANDAAIDANDTVIDADDTAIDADDAPPADKDEPQAKTTKDDEELSIAGDDDDTAASTTSASPVDDAPENPNTDAALDVIPTPPVVQATSPPPLATPAATTKPMLRTDAAVSDSTTLHARLNQGSPLLLLSFAVICCGFLLLWVRKRRAQDATGGDAKSASVGAARSSKVQYSRIENKSESPFEGNDDDDDDRGDNWDDWEGDSGGRLSDDADVTTTAYQSALYSNPNPFAAASASPPVSPEIVAQSVPPARSSFAVAPRLPAPMGLDAHHGRSARDLLLPEVALTPGSTGGARTGPGSNSSSDSYEVVTDDPLLLHSSPFTSSKASPPADDADKQQQEEDDLFSQFGMVPTFKKSAQPALPTFMQTPKPAAGSHRSHALTASAASATAAPVSAAAASALFAAEMDDIATAAASDEWGEDDEWVQGI